MTTDEKLDQLTHVVSEQAKFIGDLAGLVNTLPGSVRAHDNQVETLIALGKDRDLPRP